VKQLQLIDDIIVESYDDERELIKGWIKEVIRF
jgi:hypothetical protein